MESEAIKTFKELGLTEYESKALAFLLTKPDINAEEIAVKSSVPYSKIYAILNSLEKRGLIKHTLERPKKYKSIDPLLVADTILESKEKELIELRRLAEGKKQYLQQLYLEGEKPQKKEIVWLCPTRQAVFDEVINVFATCKKNLYILSKASWEDFFENKTLGKIARKVAEKNIKTMNILPQFIYDSIDFKTLPSDWKAYFASKNTFLRILPKEKIVHSIVIRDDESVGLSIKNPDTEKAQSGIVINNQLIVKSLIDYFNILWGQARGIEKNFKN